MSANGEPKEKLCRVQSLHCWINHLAVGPQLHLHLKDTSISNEKNRTPDIWYWIHLRTQLFISASSLDTYIIKIKNSFSRGSYFVKKLLFLIEVKLLVFAYWAIYVILFTRAEKDDIKQVTSKSSWAQTRQPQCSFLHLEFQSWLSMEEKKAW